METECKYDKVMLIDDNELDNFLSQKVMEKANFSNKIYLNSSANNAIDFLMNLGQTGEPGRKLLPEVIFVDLNMPIMDGFQFLHYYKTIITKNVPKSKLAVLTSSVNKADEEKAKSIIPDIVFIRKPLTAEVLNTLC